MAPMKPRGLQFSPNIIMAMPDRISQHECAHRLIPAAHYGYDKEGAPIYWERTGFVQSHWSEVMKHFSVDELIQYHIQSQEACEIRFSYASAKFGKPITKAITVFDMKHLTISLDASSILYIKKILEIDQGNYPERLKALYIINCPWYFQLLFKIFKPFIDQRTSDKFVILGTDFLEVMLERIDISMIPLEMGGKAKDLVWIGPFPEESGVSDLAMVTRMREKFTPETIPQILRPEEIEALAKAVKIADELGVVEEVTRASVAQKKRKEQEESAHLSKNVKGDGKGDDKMPSTASTFSKKKHSSHLKNDQGFIQPVTIQKNGIVSYRTVLPVLGVLFLLWVIWCSWSQQVTPVVLLQSWITAWVYSGNSMVLILLLLGIIYMYYVIKISIKCIGRICAYC